MVFVVFLCLAASAGTVAASSHLRSNANMQPEKVAATLMNVQNEWKAQAHVFAQCAGRELSVCKEAPEAFQHSCVKVVSTVVLSSGGSPDDSSEYMTDVCSQKILSAWHRSKCNSVGTAILNKMSGNPVENRQNYFLHAKHACTDLWTEFVDEQKKIRDLEAEADKKEAAEEAVEDTKIAQHRAQDIAEKKVQIETDNQADAISKAAQTETAAAEQHSPQKSELTVPVKATPGQEEVEIVIAPAPEKKTASSKDAPAAAVKPAQKATSDIALLQMTSPADELAKEMTHDLEINFQKIAPFGKEDTAKELQDHASKTQDTLVDAVENAEVAEIKRAVFRALTRLRAATIKEFDTIARLETQAIDAYNDAHHFRAENPLAHLHEDEAPVSSDKLKSFH